MNRYNMDTSVSIPQESITCVRVTGIFRSRVGISECLYLHCQMFGGGFLSEFACLFVDLGETEAEVTGLRGGCGDFDSTLQVVRNSTSSYSSGFIGYCLDDGVSGALREKISRQNVSIRRLKATFECI